MASKATTIVHFTDDLDGTKAEGTVAFSVGGQSYEIDLSKRNRAALEKALRPYIEAGRKVRAPGGSAARARKSAPASSAKRTDLPEIRAWAQQNGYSISDRGRIPVAVTVAFDAR